MYRNYLREVLLRSLAATVSLLLPFALSQGAHAAEVTTPGTALVRHAPQITGTVQGSVQQMLGENVSLPGGSTISDELLVPGTPTLHLNGKPAFGGTITGNGSSSPSGYEVTLNGQARLGHLLTRTNPVALKAVAAPANPAGTRDLTVNSAGQNIGSWSTIRNLTLNGNAGQYPVPPGVYGDFIASSGSGFTVGVAGSSQPAIYEFQHLTLNARARLEVVGPVVIKVKHDLVHSGQAGTSTNPAWLEVQISHGGVTLNGGSCLYGYVFAPNGTATIGGNAELNGGLECDGLTVNGKGLLRLWQREGGSGNQPPTAENQTVPVIEDTPTPITLTAVDPDNGTLAYIVTSQPQHGTLSGSAPNLVYTPALDSTAPDSFTFTVSDGVATSDIATVSITVTPVNDAPVATPQSLTATEDIPLPLTLGGTDVEGSPLTVVEVSDPPHGSVALQNGVWVYTPDSDYNGPDEFTFKVSDGELTSTAARVAITVEPMNDTPTATPRQVEVVEDGELAIIFAGLDIDGDPLTYAIASNPAHGALEVTSSGVIYRPAPNSNLPDSFTYTASDGATTSAPALVTITVFPKNDAPVAQSGSIETDEDTAVAIALQAGDIENDSLTYQIVTPPAHGALSLNTQLSAANSYTYTPEPDYHGPDAFTFKVNDGQIDSAAAEIRVTVHPVNDVPVAHTQTVSAVEDTPQPITLTADDIDHDTLAFEIVTQPAHGVLTLNAQPSALNSYTYTPALNFDQSDAFTFRVFDGTAWSAPATVTINVAPRNDAPVIADRSGETAEDTPVTLDLVATDVDDAVPSLIYQVVGNPLHGTASVNGDQLTYQPSANYYGDDIVRVRVTDGSGAFAEANVAVTITPVNDAPTLLDSSVTVQEDGVGTFSLNGNDIEEDALTYRVVGMPSHGLAAIQGNQLTYTPSANYNGPDSIRVRVVDGQGGAMEANVSIDVTPVNDAPVANAGQDANGTMGTAVALNGAVSDIDTEAGALTVSWTKLSGPGAVGFANAGAASTEALFGAPGTYVLRLSISDGEFTASDDVSVTVAPGNQPPSVNAGADQTLSQPGVATLSGTVSDDGLPAGGSLRHTWAKVSGPGEVTINDPRSLATAAAFTIPGTYVLRLSANDGQLAANDEITVEVAQANMAPVVNAGPDAQTTIGQSFAVAGQVQDDGLPAGTGVSVLWSKVSGPGDAVFASPGETSSTVTFSAPGTYVLKLEASDSVLSAGDEMSVTVAPTPNQAPVVNAGSDRSATGTRTVALSGSVTDDGLPAGSQLATSWVKLSGPGSVTFSAQSNPVSEATFGQAGTYVLRLSALDGELSAADDVVVTVSFENASPVVNAGPDMAAMVGQPAHFQGVVSDDGLPDGAALSITWSKVSGPGAVTFSSTAAPTMDATFAQPGTYVLRLTANDSELSTNDDVTVTVTPSPFTSWTYTKDADFDLGTAANVDHSLPDQLQLSETAQPFNFIWIANSSKGTIVKIDTDTGKVLGEYWSSPNGQPRNPSRTTVDLNGSVWGTNRDGNSVLHIGLAEAGQWIDKNGNGRLDTSTGLGDLRPWTNANNADTNGGISTAEDECIIHYTRVNSSGTRHVAVTRDNDIWVSGTGGRAFDLIDGKTGRIKRSEPTVGYGGYGGLIDRFGVIWSSRPLLRWDTSKPLTGPNGQNWTGYNHDSYGLAVGPDGNVWNTALEGNVIRKFAPDGTLIGTYQHGFHWAQGCCVDKQGHVWVAHSLQGGTNVGHLTKDGVFVGNVTVGNGPTGVAVDAHGKIWAACYDGTCSRIDPNGGPIGADGVTRVGAVDLTTINLGGQLYNYSDMTGSTLVGKPLSGTWAVIRDSGSAGTEWGAINWTGHVCDDGKITVSVASSENPASFAQGQVVTSGGALNVANGRYLKITVLLQRSSAGESPIVYDLTVGTKNYVPGAVANATPTVSAGAEQDVPWPMPVQLRGNVCDDDLPAGATRTVQWSMQSGPGVATFASPQSLATSVTFSEPGVYILRMDGSDSQAGDSATVRITSLPPNTPPVVFAGPDQSAANTSATVALHGWVSDDGLPHGTPLTATWSVLQGPGSVSFANAAAADTTAAFGAPGIYVLKLSASDSALEASDLVEVRIATPCSLDAAKGIVAWWPGNGDARDIVGGHDGQLYGGTSFSGAKVSLGFDFDAVNDFVQVPATPDLNVGAGAGFTMEFWIQPDSVTRWQPLLEWNGGTPGSRGAHVWLDGNWPHGRLWVNFIDTAGNEHRFESNAGCFVANELQHVAVTYEKWSGWLRIYRNGALFQEARIDTFTARTDSDLYLAHSPSDPSFFGGILDEVALYNRPLTWELTSIYQAGSVGKCPPSGNEPPLVDAGPDRAVPMINVPQALQGLVSDDSLPVGAPVTAQWSVVSGPGSVTFGDAASPATTAAFGASGIYVLKLTANDTRDQASDTVQVRVDLPCSVEAPAGLVAWWPGNGDAKDVASGQNGELLHGTLFAPGESSLAFSFDGIDDGVRVPKSPALDLGSQDSFTIEFWANPVNSDRWQPILEWNNGVTPGAHVWLDGNWPHGRVWVNFVDTSGNPHTFESAPGLLQAGQWQHIAISYDKLSGLLRIWRNGALVHERFLGRFTSQTNYDLYVARHPSGYDRDQYPYAGMIDELSIYRRVLDSEITEIYQAGAVGKCPIEVNEPPLVNAGPDRTVSSAGESVALAGTVSDDGLPAGSTVKALWSLVDGPGTVSFADNTAPATTATFSAPGIYVLRLTADDSARAESDTMEVRVASLCVAEPPAGLLAWWPANGDNRDVVAGNDGQLLSGASFAPGKVSLGWNFDGVDDAVKVPAAPELNLGAKDRFTIEFWVNPAEITKWQPLLEWNGGGPGPRGAHVWLDGNWPHGRLWINFVDTDGHDRGFESRPGIFVAGEWQHIAITYDKATGAVRFYRNGSIFDQAVIGSFTPQTAYDLYVANTPSDSPRFRGLIDELSFYDRALDAELLGIADSGAVGKCPLSGNTPPFVDAGPDQESAQPGDAVHLAGWVSDDGLPAGSPVAARWSLVQGPGTATFDDPASASTNVRFTVAGIYILKLSANDTECSAEDQVEVRVAPACQDAPSGAVAWWPGNNGGHDIVGGHDAVLLNGARFVPAKVAEGFQFDGANDVARVAAAPELDLGTGDGFTTEFWVNPVDVDDWHPLIVWHGGYPNGPAGAHLWIDGNWPHGRLWVNFVDTDGHDHGWESAPGFFVAGQWQHVAVSYDKTAGKLRVYRNGTLFTPEINFNSFTPRTNLDLYFGHHPREPKIFGGLLDEITLYNRVLSDSEISTVAALGSAGKCPPSRPNQAPYVFAGLDRQAVLADGLALQGAAHDDGEPSGSTLAVQWSQVSGPGTAVFASPRSLATTVQFPATGLYVLRLTADDGALSAHGDIRVTITNGAVNLPPAVSAGENQTVRLPNSATLAGSTADDGLLAPITVRWRKITGPGIVTFAEPTNGATTASFSSAGIYLLRLTADDGQFTSSSDVTITVQPTAPDNRPPLVNAGPDQPAYMSIPASVKGTASDDGLPLGTTLAVQWSLLSGPGSVVFADAHRLTTGVEFSIPGRYVLRLTVSDSDVSVSDDVTFDVYPAFNQAPTVEAGPNQQVSISDGALLTGTITDDGLPLGQTLTTRWNKLSGPGAVSFTEVGAGQTRAQFAATGTYILELIADDSEKRGSDWLTVVVGSAHNQPPVANAGPDQLISIDSIATITPTLQDDGLPNGYMTIAWQVISGPGDVRLERDEDTVHARFGAVGSYVLRLVLSDTEFTVTDDVQITVTPGANAAPTVTLTAPVTAATVSPGEPTQLTADASDPEGSLLGVEFYVDGQLVDSDTEAPFAVTWTPSQLGPHSITAVAIDAIGQQTSSAAVTVNAVVRPPSIHLATPLDGAGFNPGTNIALSASASSAAGIGCVYFFADGILIATDTAAPYTTVWATSAIGAHQLTATAVANDGQTASATATVYALARPAEPPTVDLTSPVNGGSVTAPTPVLGTVDSPALRDWTLDVRPLNDDCGDWLVLATGTGPVNHAALGNFDPTLLLNGHYEIRLTARDRFGAVSSISNTVAVEGDMKVGHFSVAFQDLQVPLAGIPLTVTRTYDSREHCPGDFGIGWRLDVESLRLEQSAPMGQGWGIFTTVGTFTTPSTYQLVDDAAHLISVRMPDGELLRFRPKLVVDRPYSRLASMLDADGDDIGQAWLPFRYDQKLRVVYRAQGGSKGATLRARGYAALDPWNGGTTTLNNSGDSARVYVSEPTDGPIDLAISDNSAQDAAMVTDATGWELTLKDGRVFLFDARGRLESMRDRVGNVLSFVRDGAGRILAVTHSSGGQVVFHRDADGFVERITDPRGNELHYQYDTEGNLRAFFDREADPDTEAATQTFTYKPGSHLLEDLRDGKGVRAAKNYYDAQGRLQRTVDANGKETVFTHDVAGRTETITDRAGNVTVHRYDERGNIVKSRTPDGTVTTTAYHTWSDGRKSDLKTSETITGLFTNDAGQLVPKTITTAYAYEDDDAATPPANDGLLRKVVDPLGNTTRFGYDGSGNLLTVTDPLNHTTVNTYYPGTNLLQTVQDALGNLTSYTYDARGQLDTETRTVTVTDAEGNTAVQTLTTDTDYDTSGFLVKMTDAAGHATSYENDIHGNRLFERTTRTNAAGQVVPVVVEHEYDANDRLVKTWDAEHPRTSFATPTSETVFDENGKPSVVYDALRRTTQMYYTARGELERTHYADGTSESTLYDADGRREFAINRRGKTSQTIYDALGRVTNTVFLGSTGDTPVTLSAVTYDAAGRVYQSTDANSHTTTSVYDNAGRRVWTIDALGRASHSQYDAAGNLRFFTDARNHTTEHVYDALNRRTTTILPAAPLDVNGDGVIDSGEQNVVTSTSTAYDELGRRISETDANGLTKRFIYDALGRLVSVHQPSTITNQPVVTSYSYDELGNQLTQTDANQHTTKYSYDSIGRRLTRTLPLGQVESMQYDVAGNLRYRTDFNGKTTEYQYDAQNRLRFRIPDASLSEPSVEWRYTTSGQRERMIDGHGETVYGYDSRDRLTSKASPEGTLSYTYDHAGNLTSITSSNPSGTAVSYRYDDLNRLHEVEENGGEITSYGYDEVGNLERFTTANGVSHTYAYNALNRLTALTLNSQQSTLSSYTYTQLRTGHRSSAAEQLAGTQLNPQSAIRNLQYRYDNLYRLTNESLSVSQLSAPNSQLSGSAAYTLDPVGNRLARTSTIAALSNQSFSYDANDRLQSDTYDANGNTKVGHVTLNPQGAEGPTQTANDTYYTYDSENRLTVRSGSINNQPSTINIQYDGDGNKVRETVNGQTISYLIDSLNPTGYAQVVEELQNGTVIRTYTYGHDLLLQDQRDGSGHWSATWFGYDGHGSVRLLTDALGQTTDRYDYDAFGVLLSSSGTTTNFYKYCGERFEPSLGLYYLRARYLNAANGRFWNMDTYEGSRRDPASLHRYLYATGNPVIGRDPTGRTTLIEEEEVAAIDGEVVSFARVGVRTAFQEGGAEAGGSALRTLGELVERKVIELLERMGGRVVDTAVKFGRRRIDLLGKIGQRLVTIESKYNLPIKAGEAMTRLIAQIEAATGEGELVVFIANDAEAAALERILGQLSGEALSRVTFVLGYVNLAEYLETLVLL